MKRMHFLMAFFCGAPIMLIISFFLSRSDLQSAAPQDLNAMLTPQAGALIFAALPEQVGTLEVEIIPGDARTLILHDFLKDYNSPLAPYADEMVKAADQYKLDFRLIPAISMQESGGCKHIPENSFNCWGWGIHERGTLHFSSFEEGILTVSKGLRDNYINRGLVTPEQIMSKYTPSSPGTWSNAVRYFMDKME